MIGAGPGTRVPGYISLPGSLQKDSFRKSNSESQSVFLSCLFGCVALMSVVIANASLFADLLEDGENDMHNQQTGYEADQGSIGVATGKMPPSPRSTDNYGARASHADKRHIIWHPQRVGAAQRPHDDRVCAQSKHRRKE